MTVNRFIPGMCEISGMGGIYEEACRIMVSAGVDWLEARPGVVIEKKGWTAPDESKWKEDNAALKEVEGYVANECPGGGPSGAMHGAVIQHLMMLQMFGGWTSYVEQSREAFAQMYPVEALSIQHNQP